METNISYEAATTYKLGGELKEIAQELQALELKDKNLQQFQNNFYQTFIEFSDAFMIVDSFQFFKELYELN